MSYQNIINGVLNIVAAMFRGMGLVLGDFHRAAYRRWGDRVYGYYAIAGILALLILSGALWALITALMQAVIWLILLAAALMILVSMVRRK